MAKSRPASQRNTMSVENSGIERISQLARLLDSVITIPGTSISIGLDGIIGLLPGIGDGLSFGLSAFILYEGARLGVSKRTLSRMLGNITADALVGLIPVLGDLFDIGFKANLKNIALIRADLEKAGSTARSGKNVTMLLVLLLLLSIFIVFLLCSTAFCLVLFLLL